jgi:hypothetical protein
LNKEAWKLLKKIYISAVFTIFFGVSSWMIHSVINGTQVFSIKITGLSEEKKDYELLMKTGIKTTATVTGITTPRRSSIRDRIIHYLSAEFTADKKYPGYYTVKDDELKSLHAGNPVGKPVDIIYSPENPLISAPLFNFEQQYQNISANISLFTTIKKIFINLLIISAAMLALFITWIIIRKSLKS